MIRIIVENDLRLPLSEALDAALTNYNWLPPSGNALAHALAGHGTMLPFEPGLEATKEALLTFFADRLRVYLRNRGKRHDLVNAVFAAGGEDDLVRLLDRIEALELLLDSDDGANLLIAYRRAANILRIEETKDGQRYNGPSDPALFAEAQEYVLYGRIAEAGAFVETALEHESFVDAMLTMATLREPVDALFDHVTVNCEDPAMRRNRLLMLSQIRSTLDRVADFSKIEG